MALSDISSTQRELKQNSRSQSHSPSTEQQQQEKSYNSGFAQKWHALNQKYLITPKLLYFFLNLEVYAFYVFKGSFIKKFLQIDAKKYGFLMSLMACIGFPCMTMWGRLADHLGRPKLVLTVLAIATAATFELLAFQVGAPKSTTHYVWVTFVLSLYALFFCGLCPLMDIIALKILSGNPAFNKEMYGRQRLWGSLGYCVSTLMAAYLMGRIGDRALFGIIPACALVFCLVLFFAGPADMPKARHSIEQDTALPTKKPEEEEQQQQKKKKEEEERKQREEQEMMEQMPKWRRKIRWPLLRLLTDGGYLFFLLAVFMTGSSRSIMTNYLSMYWELGMELSKNTVAIAAIFGVVIEVVIFFFASHLAFMGNFWMLLLAQLAMALRGWLYAFLPPQSSLYPAVFAIELLKGAAFGFTQLAGVKVASASAPPSLQATSQAIYNSVYAQLPAVIAALGGGVLYEIHGPKVMFIITAAISTGSFLAFLLKWGWDGSIGIGNCRRHRQPSARLPAIHVPSEQPLQQKL